MPLARLGWLCLSWCCALAAAPPDTSLFEYDRTLPFELEKEPLSPRRDAILAGASFQPVKGRRADLILVEPASDSGFTGKHPAVVFQHGGGQSMSNYIAEAILLAKAGAVSLILEAPYRLTEEERSTVRKGAAQRQGSADIVICIRRAIDLLVSRPDVDAAKLAYVGHSYGGNAGAVLTAIDKRIKTFVLMGLTAKYTRHIAESPLRYWQDYRAALSKDELAETLALLRSVDPDQYLPESSLAPVFFQ